MMSDLETPRCRFCEQDATRTCGRCGKAYCADHGRDLCQRCLSPESALPSQALFRGSLVALVVAGAVGIWVLVAPPTLPGEHRLAKSQAQNPAAVQPVPRPASGRSAVPTPVASAPASPTAAVARSYTVQLGDTLSGIAESFGTTVEAIRAANPGVSQSNLKAGQELLIPPAGATPGPSALPSVSAVTSTPGSTATLPASSSPAATPVQ